MPKGEIRGGGTRGIQTAHHVRLAEAMNRRVHTNTVHRDGRDAERGGDLAKRLRRMLREERDNVVELVKIVLEQAIFYEGGDGTLMVKMTRDLRNRSMGTLSASVVLKNFGLELIDLPRDESSVFEAKGLVPICRDLGLLDKMPEKLSALAARLSDDPKPPRTR